MGITDLYSPIIAVTYAEQNTLYLNLLNLLRKIQIVKILNYMLRVKNKIILGIMRGLQIVNFPKYRFLVL